MNIEQARNYILLEQSGELTPRQQRELEALLATSPEGQAYRRELSMVIDAARKGDTPAPSPLALSSRSDRCRQPCGPRGRPSTAAWLCWKGCRRSAPRWGRRESAELKPPITLKESLKNTPLSVQRRKKIPNSQSPEMITSKFQLSATPETQAPFEKETLVVLNHEHRWRHVRCRMGTPARR